MAEQITYEKKAQEREETRTYQDEKRREGDGNTTGEEQD